MRLETSLQQKLQLQLKLAPQIIQSIEILQLAAVDLRDMVEQELAENETLEVDLASEPRDGEAETVERSASDEEQSVAETMDRLEQLVEGGYDWDGPPRPSWSYNGEKDRKLEAMQNTAARPAGLQDDLVAQLVDVQAPPRLLALAREVIFNLSDDGLLMYPLEEILRTLDEDYSEEEAEAALSIVQNLEPRGVGARDARECLLLQLDPRDPRFTQKYRVVADYLEDWSKNRLPRMARELGLALPELQELLEELKSELSLQPGSRVGGEPSQYIQPDVVLEYVDGEYEIRLEDDYYPSLRVSPSYLRLLEQNKADPQVRELIKRKVESARWLIDAIEQRRNTLYKVCRRIVDYQRDFLDHGPKHLKPLKMQQVADDLEIHVSTVSRAISDKWIQTHRGIFPLKKFFTGATEGAAGTESTVAVKERVKEIIDAEDKASPLSDEDIATRLRAAGLSIARRTVTKYREALGVPSSRQRKVWS
jgi:RNA polymerase sigma-54 factor